MKQTIFFIAVLILAGCQAANRTENSTATGNSSEANKNATTSGGVNQMPAEKAQADNKTSAAQGNQPKNVREFFNLLPQKYFLLEGCEPKTDKNCEKARAQYLKNYLQVEDLANGYMKGGCDGAQSCFEMAIFKRPDESYIVGLSTFAEGIIDSYFLDYKNGNWSDISSKVVPEFSNKNIYEMPRQGTTVPVFAKTNIEQVEEIEFSEKGKKIYDLEWKDGKFTIKK